jgi:hypothetical protein
MSAAKKPLQPLVIIVAGFIAFWVCLVVLFAAQTMLAMAQPWTQAVRGSLILWVPWMAVSPLMLAAAYVLPVGGARLWKFLLGHLLIAVALMFMAGWLSRNVLPAPDHAAQDELAAPPGSGAPANALQAPPPGGGYAAPRPPPLGPDGYPLRPGDPGYGPPRPGDPGFVPPAGMNGPPPGPYGGQPPPEAGPAVTEGQRRFTATMVNFLRTLPVGLPLYLTSLFLIGSLNLHRISLEKERRTVELERQLTDARIETLRAQLHPHFLFNTLNALMSLVHTDPAKAEEMILCLSSLLRATLEAKDKLRIPLRDELQLAHEYLSIQSLRYGDRLKTLEILPPDTLACAVPPLILQLVLENAIKYAIDRHAAGGTITLRAQRLGEKLIIEVEDSGSGLNAEARESHGIGITNVRARLAASFPGREVNFDLLPNHLGGITARFQLPVTAEKDNGGGP